MTSAARPRRRTPKPPLIGRELLDSLQSEASYQGQIIEYAVLQGWIWDHKRDDASAARTPAGTKAECMEGGDGSPDLILCRAPRLLLIEVKKQNGRLRAKQRVWRDALLACPGVEYMEARPNDWERVKAALA